MAKYSDFIHIQNASENNLAHISLDIPKRSFVVITGPSGSGKSTLAFDTLYMEARRRYLDTLSMYARQFVGPMKRPNVERITGLTPSIAVVQGTLSNNARSTVGTVTEVYDRLRLLWGRAGEQICPHCQIPVAASSAANIVEKLMAWPQRTKAIIYAPLVIQRKGQFTDLFEKLKKSGFTRVRIDGTETLLESVSALSKTTRHTIELVVDRIIIKTSEKNRIADAISTALSHANGQCLVQRLLDDGSSQMHIFSETATCPKCGMAFPECSPNMLAFNTPQGACTTCHGLGMNFELLPETQIGDPSLPILASTSKPCAYLPFANAADDDAKKLIASVTTATLNKLKILPSTPWLSLSPDQQKKFLDANAERLINLASQPKYAALKDELIPFGKNMICADCGGSRLNLHARNVFFAGESIANIQNKTIAQAIHFFEHLQCDDLEPVAAKIVRDLLPSILERLHFIDRVGLGYLQLNRAANSLSGGESQRIRLAGLLGNGLTAVTYILDEPSIGLHARDQDRLIGVLKELRDRGNTVIAVEHDEATIRACDFLVDIGPHAGKFGGNILYAGNMNEINHCSHSLTIDYLNGIKSVPVPSSRRSDDKGAIRIRGARKNNLKNIDVDIPLGRIVCVTGVSGSGKSTLINEILIPAVRASLNKSSIPFSDIDDIDGLEPIHRLLEVDQKPIGKTPRSNPATYTKVFDSIRTLFAETIDSKMYGYSASRYSFNVSASKSGGRCETCAGAGVRTIEMKFLSNAYIPCEDCAGKRFNNATLRVKYQGLSIADVLDLSFQDALTHFNGQPKITKILKAVCDVGLGYIKLGQPSPSLSGGEAQRMKLAKEIAKTSHTPTLFIFDEPSTGLHSDDVKILVDVLQKLPEMGHSVIVIEHNLDIIKSADYIIDIGPEPGDQGGEIVASGTPESVAQNINSHTGRYLKKILNL